MLKKLYMPLFYPFMIPITLFTITLITIHKVYVDRVKRPFILNPFSLYPLCVSQEPYPPTQNSLLPPPS